MGPGILGKKIGMTQMFRPNGEVVPVTLLKAGPCVVVQRKTPTTDGYDAIQLGFVEFVKAARINKPKTGHLKKANAEGVKFLKELRLHPGDGDLKAGDKVLVDQFKANEKVDVTGVSKGHELAKAMDLPVSSKGIISAAVPDRTVRCSTGPLVRLALRAFRRAFSRECAWRVTWVFRT
jgi:hypothetical protein